MNYHRVLVKDLKEKDPKFLSVAKEPGVYRWWFPRDLAEKLLEPLAGVDTTQISKKEIVDGEEYWCLYFGIAKDLRERIRWHACLKHSPSAVKHGFLSTLRQSISALLGLDQTMSADKVSDVLEKCYWDWYPTATKEDAEDIEKEQLTKVYFPINIQGNKKVGSAVIKRLKELRKKHKK